MIESRWNTLSQVSLPISSGDRYTEAGISQALHAVRNALREDDTAANDLQETMSVSGRYVDACITVVNNSKLLDVSIRPIGLKLHRNQIGPNLLPAPRSNRPTVAENLPWWLLMFDPGFGAEYDREVGFSETVGFSADLLNLRPGKKRKLIAHKKARVNLEGRGRRSLNEDFYKANVGLAFVRQLSGAMLEKLALEASFSAERDPLADGGYFANATRICARVEARPRMGVLNRLTLNSAYRWSTKRLRSRDEVISEDTTENAFESHVIIDGGLMDGFMRLGLWGDVGVPTEFDGTYRRVVGIVGYEKEIPFGKNQTIGLEAIVGGGGAWGSVPQYARFYGGQREGEFLYEAPDSSHFDVFPVGPLLRSVGRGQAGLLVDGSSTRGGATSFWHLNVTASFPIPAWSRPLIPDEDIGGGTSLKDVVKNNSLQSTKNILQATYEQRGFSPEEAERKATNDLREIGPAVRFIADYANLFSLRPLFMLDVAGLGGSGDVDDRTRIAVGGGLQLTIVVAKFQLGYMQTVKRSGADDSGNFVARLIFQNLF